MKYSKTILAAGAVFNIGTVIPLHGGFFYH